MKHRLVNNGFGANAKVHLDNEGKKPPKRLCTLMMRAYEKYFRDAYGVDFQWGKDELSLGVEPTYQYQPLCVITLRRDKKECTITTGHAFGHYGSGVRSRTKKYGDYKRRSKFVKVVDYAHSVLFGQFGDKHL